MESVPYASAVGRHDLAFDVFLVNMFMANPGRVHWSVVSYFKVSFLR